MLYSMLDLPPAPAEPEPMSDFIVINNGSTISFMCLTDAARSWCQEHLPDDCPMMGADTYVVEVNYARDIQNGMESNGLTFV